MPRVAVLVPAYNAGATIGEALQSVLDNQSFADVSVTVVDDASTDDTAQIVAEVAARDPRVRLLVNDTNLGIAGNRNRAVARSESEFVAWQDADDLSLPDRLRHQVSYLEAHPEVGVVGGWLEFFGGSSSSVRRYPEHDAELRRQIFRSMPVAQPTSMIRREILERAGPYDSEFEPAEDLDMAFRLGRLTRFANVQAPTLRYRESPTSATASRLRRIERKTLQLRFANRRDEHFAARPADYAYGAVQAATMFMPATLRISLFNRIRNERVTPS